MTLMEGIMRLSNLVNIGPKLEVLLTEVGIEDAAMLRSMGSIEATYLLCQKNMECVNKLFAIEGAILGMRWHNITKEEKERLSEGLERRVGLIAN